MSRRIVKGVRANGDSGLFVAPAGLDAFTASDNQLILSISGKVSQLILLGYVNGSGTVVLGLTRRPIVLLTSQNTISELFLYSQLDGPIRPSPYRFGGSAATATINGNGDSLSISSAIKTYYAVFNEALA